MSIIAKSIEEAGTAKGEIRAGGTDYSARRRLGVAGTEVVDISRLQNLNRIDFTPAGATIGTLVTIEEVAQSQVIREMYPGLAMAAGALATPQVRRAASMGGALLQRTRCWYYRHDEFSCFKKGGNTCPAREGNHQYGVCFDLGGCVFPHPSTLGMALLAYGASVMINGQLSRPIADLYGADATRQDHQLKSGDVLSHIVLPPPMKGEKAAYFRSISRARAEWPLVEVLVRYREAGGTIRDASIAMGGVANVPLELEEVASFINDRRPDQDTFQKAGKMAAANANPLPGTAYKLDLVKATVFETLRHAQEGIWGGEG